LLDPLRERIAHRGSVVEEFAGGLIEAIDGMEFPAGFRGDHSDLQLRGLLHPFEFRRERHGLDQGIRNVLGRGRSA
jgi:hypothetical protein